MDWIKINEIFNLKLHPKFLNNEIYFFDRDKNFVIYDEKNVRKINKINFAQEYPFRIIDDDIYFYLEDNISFFDRNNYKLCKVWVPKDGIPSFFNKTLILERNYIRKEKKLKVSIYKLNDLKLLWSKEFINYRFPLSVDGLLLLTDISYSKFKKIDPYTGEELLEINLKKAGNLHLHDNILIVPTKGNRLYGIDAESGKQLWELEDPDMAPLGYTIYNQKLYDIGRRFFIRIDHKTGKVEYKKEIKPVFEEHNFSLTDFVMDENYLYFTDSSKCKIGIMDLTNFEIVWTYQIEKTPENWQIHEPVVHGNRMYVKDEIGTLHIFEKTAE
jgi:outer membrane protein assembly factor BamB